MSKKKPETRSLKLGDALFLATIPVPKKAEEKPAKPPATHHIAVVDCSYSMVGDLPQLREQLKAKLPKLLTGEDTFSCIWFSSRREFGVLLEGEEVQNAKDLKIIHGVIDKFLRPVGATGFVEPLQEAKAMVARLQKKRPGPVSLFFMSDGCDNQWSRGEVLKAAEEAGAVVAATTIVEYGYYADRRLLAEMSEKAKGCHIFAEDFGRFMPLLEKSLQGKFEGQSAVKMDLPKGAKEGIVFGLHDGDVYAIEASAGEVPAFLDEVHCIVDAPLGKVSDTRSDFAAHYAALGLFATRMKSDVVFAILKDVADTAFIDDFQNCFGKQAYSRFTDAATAAAFDPTHRFRKGRDPNRIPPSDAFTVLDLLNLLQESDARLLLDDPKFRYSKIGRGRVDADEKGLVFTRIPKEAGYEIFDLTFNQTRPNVSVLVKREGTVDLTAKAPPKGVPAIFPTHQFKNYTIVKDGLVNVDRLPAVIDSKTLLRLYELYEEDKLRYGALVDWPPKPGTKNGLDLFDSYQVVFDLRAIPIMNRKSVVETSAADYFRLNFELQKKKAEQKVYNDYKKRLLPPKANEGFAFVYGQEAADFLKAVGIDQANGYAPLHTKQAEPSGDFYMSRELKCSLKGLSSLPKVEEARAGKGGFGGQLMKPYIDEIETYLGSSAYLNAKDPKAALDGWLRSAQVITRAETRALILQMAKLTFNILVGQIWFSEFKDLSENSMTITVDGKPIVGTAKLEEIRIDL